MSPKKLMLLGAFVAACALYLSSVAVDLHAYSLTFLGFAGGAVFGKGYGVWEERSEKKENEG